VLLSELSSLKVSVNEKQHAQFPPDAVLYQFDMDPRSDSPSCAKPPLAALTSGLVWSVLSDGASSGSYVVTGFADPRQGGSKFDCGLLVLHIRRIAGVSGVKCRWGPSIAIHLHTYRLCLQVNSIWLEADSTSRRCLG